MPPPHAGAEVHKRIMARLMKMTPDEVFQMAVEAGIYTPEGELTEPYASEEPSAHRPRDAVFPRREELDDLRMFDY